MNDIEIKRKVYMCVFVCFCCCFVVQEMMCEEGGIVYLCEEGSVRELMRIILKKDDFHPVHTRFRRDNFSTVSN